MKTEDPPSYLVLAFGEGGGERIEPETTEKFLVFSHSDTKTLFLYEIEANAVAMCKIAGPPGESSGATLRLEDRPDGLLIHSSLGIIREKEHSITYRYDSSENRLSILNSTFFGKKSKKNNKF